MNNIKLSFMSHWKTIPYKTIDNFRDFYYEDNSNHAYYSDWDRILRYYAATGYDGIEIPPWDMREIMALFGTPQNFTAFAADHGVAVSGMFGSTRDAHDSSKFDEVLAAGRQSIDTVAAFGGKHWNFMPEGTYYAVGPLTREGVQNAAKVITEIGRYAIDKGIQIGIHNEFFCAINKENHHEFIELTDPRYVFYCLDTAQVSIIGDDLLEFYEQYHDRICTFHLKDTGTPKLPDSIRYGQDAEITNNGTRWFWEPGEGVLDFKGFWKLLKKYGFKGWMTVETDGTPDLLASMALSSYFINHDLANIYR